MGPSRDGQRKESSWNIAEDVEYSSRAFLVGGLSVGLALWAAGAVPVTEGGLALGAFLFFPFMFKILFGIFFFRLLFRFIGRGHRGSWAHDGDPRTRMHAWHEQAHSGATSGDKNANSEEILVVEEELGIARLVREYLEQAGFSVLAAADGEGALAAARRHRPRPRGSRPWFA